MSRSPRQNRVTPFGEIVATHHRGALMGNRGCLHDDEGRIVRCATHSAWISCKTTWPGIRRTMMKPSHYTELFFLDEATALAAGHRPCGSCRPARLRAFKQAWARAYGVGQLPRVAEMDGELRRAPPLERRGTIDAANFPDGAMAVFGRSAWLRWKGAWHRWSFAGYDEAPAALPAQLVPLTSPAMMAVISEGYRPTAALA